MKINATVIKISKVMLDNNLLSYKQVDLLLDNKIKTHIKVDNYDLRADNKWVDVINAGVKSRLINIEVNNSNCVNKLEYNFTIIPKPSQQKLI